MTQSNILVFLDLKPEGQAPLVEGKMGLSDESSAGTNNKYKLPNGTSILV